MRIEEAMRLAIAEAYQGAPYVSPNPLVGCVVLDAEGKLLRSGHHEIYGGPHAEVNALRGLTVGQLQGAHVIVTLEPCAHEGKTPSCAKMLARLPLAKVTYGLVDPNPLVAGQGADIIRAAGIEAEVFHSQDERQDQDIKQELEQVCEAFLKNFRQKEIFVALKMASSLDGQIALKTGESQWITGAEAREHVHYVRSCYDAVLVGAQTVRFDNPSLNIRHSSIQKKNKVVVLDPAGEMLIQYGQLKISQVHSSDNVYWCVSEKKIDEVRQKIQSLQSAPQILSIPELAEGSLDLRLLLRELWKVGVRSVMIEGGAQTASSFLRQQLVDRLFLFQAPIILGAGGSLAWTSHVSIAKMQDKVILSSVKRLSLGADQLITGRVNYANS